MQRRPVWREHRRWPSKPPSVTAAAFKFSPIIGMAGQRNEDATQPIGRWPLSSGSRRPTPGEEATQSAYLRLWRYLTSFLDSSADWRRSMLVKSHEELRLGWKLDASEGRRLHDEQVNRRQGSERTGTLQISMLSSSREPIQQQAVNSLSACRGSGSWTVGDPTGATPGTIGSTQGASLP